MLVVGSEHSLEALDAAWDLLERGASALDAVVAATRLVEDDLRVRSVGTGGYPNLVGAVELDASVMEGTRRRAGAVAALGGFAHPVSVARAVMERLPHVLLVGDGAARFAGEIGAERGELLTEEAQRYWAEGVERARATAGEELLAQATALTARPDDAAGTVDVLALDGRGCVASAVSTSGWPFRWPGRAGDSPLIGAGNYCDDRYGAAGCTGFGELAIRAGTARSVIAALAAGAAPLEAAISALSDVWSLVAPGRDMPMNVVVLDAAGRHCGASTQPGGYYAWRDEQTARAVRAERVVVARPRHAGSADAEEAQP
ncbi:MAG TPA: isoaspartyl peptidase/L-asparaginase [Acidimicrobiales bacterium]|nr:isoaspartyl peptidase/L-asparaginase [Acidimicrobiales bacterium]